MWVKWRGLGHWVCVSQRKRILFELLELKKESEFQLTTCKGKKKKKKGVWEEADEASNGSQC